MKILKKVIATLLVGLLFVALSFGVETQDISMRAIIVGVGIDFDDTTNEFVTTSEILSPSGGSGNQIETISKFVVTRGQTISQAIFNVFTETGEMASLGQCQVVILGEGYYKNFDIKHSITYFNLLEALIDSSSVCCAEGSAYDLMQTHLPQEQSISFCLAKLLKESAKATGCPTTTIGEFCKGQLVLGNSGAVTLVRTRWQESVTNLSDSVKSETVSFDCRHSAVFKDYGFVTMLEDQTAEGFSLLFDETIGQYFTFNNTEDSELRGELASALLCSKDVSIECKEVDGTYQVSIFLEASLQSASKDFAGERSGQFPLNERQLNDEQLENIKQQIEASVLVFVSQMQAANADLLKIFKSFEISYGNVWREKSKTVTLADMDFELEVKVQEV